MKQYVRVVLVALFLSGPLALPPERAESAAAGSMGPSTHMGVGGGGGIMSNDGSFGMMSGMAGAPVIGEDGTAYLVTHVPAPDPGETPSSAAFTSRIVAYHPARGSVVLTLQGLVSRPVIAGGLLVATASLPDMEDFVVMGRHGTAGPGGQSVLYALALPLTESAVPIAVAMDGRFASMPVIAKNRIYVTATDFGNAMMGGGTFEMFGAGSYDFGAAAPAKTYLYVFGLDGSLISRAEIQ